MALSNYDRESGEFSVSHLREFIKNVAGCPDVERIHLVAHSRGTDVTISALRELNLHYRAQGKSTQAELKLENLVLAAPDVDGLLVGGASLEAEGWATIVRT